jgi:hypothetical protein
MPINNPINTWAAFQDFMDACCARVGAHPENASHDVWWRNMTYNKFMTDGKVKGLRIVNPGNPDDSTMIKALEGRPPFGPDLQYPQMPPDAPFSAEEIGKIRDWISRGCPDG